eukprot:CAMPEP_0174299098 /NCGR_PEP_ID=MMETSP0809-20121228/55734_1 /TAXON_ID=73025 ORGANISM="Eutreptiella gymnastica-like, Strain CCMP1594" /NCGR_SAMPLE_ID=MMETSP0809 /ASSEMBLY_ACC=CAM_ASM_000658 /LENGTH=46 /DNA_ID= /DNA_START= /DNA_END= /DNA_ORIENTATION=
MGAQNHLAMMGQVSACQRPRPSTLKREPHHGCYEHGPWAGIGVEAG